MEQETNGQRRLVRVTWPDGTQRTMSVSEYRQLEDWHNTTVKFVRGDDR